MNVVDVVLAKNYANLVSLGIKDISINGTTITFTLKDDSVQTMTFPTPKEVTEIYAEGDHIFAKYSDTSIQDIGQIIYSDMHIGSEPPTDDRITVWINQDGEATQMPTATVTETNDGADITVTDLNGTTTAHISLATVNNKINVLDARMNAFTQLEDGSTTGDAELIDARIGADGTTYANVGTAVRSQITTLKSDLVEFKDGFKKLNLWEDAELVQEGKYVCISSDGKLIYSINPSYNAWILPVNEVKTYSFSNKLRFALPIASDKETATSTALISYQAQIDISEYPNTKYLAFSIKTSEAPCVISEGNEAKEGFEPPNWHKTDVNPIKVNVSSLTTRVDALSESVSKGVVSKTGTFSASGDSLVLGNARTNLRKGLRLVFESTVTSSTDFEIGFSISEDSVYGQHNVVGVTSTNVSYNNVNYSHGLTISGRVQLIFEYLDNATADITLICNGNRFKQNIPFVMSSVAVPYVKSNGLIASDCKLTFICTDIRKKIWMFGDSYFAYADSRWTYYLKEYGYDRNVLIDGWPGMGSVNAKTSFAKLVNLGKPQYAVWFMGMNDGTDASNTTPKPEWKGYADNFIALCEANNITPIFATIPNVPNINHKGKNAWIKSSGYKYIDMCHAVGADVTSNWYGDMLSSDNIHPSESGAKALFAQVLLDLPEVMLDNL